MDGNRFVDCTFTDCDLVYAGGETEWVKTHFDHCRLGYSGPAKLTVQFLFSFGLVTWPSDNVPTALSTGGNVGKIEWHKPI